MDGNFNLTESMALLPYIAERFGREDLLGYTLEEKARVMQSLMVISDLRVSARGIYFDRDWGK